MTSSDREIQAGRDYRAIHVSDGGIYVEGDFYAAPPPPPVGTPSNLSRNYATTFVGRGKELEQLHDQLQGNQPVAISAIAGMGGIGKSELALQYAYRYAQDYPAGLCWLQARGAEVGAQVVSFGRGELGLILPDGLDLAEQVAFCWSRWRPEGDALIVVDDVNDYPTIEPYLPSDSRFKLLLTSRLNLGKSFKVLDLNVLEQEPALDLLRSLATPERINAELDAAIALCKWLGYLPLGLELAGRYLHNKPDLSIAELQERLNKQRLAARVLCRTEAGMTAQLGVAAAFELSWHELSEPAQQLGCLLALFAQAPILWGLVEQAGRPLSNELADTEVLEALRDEELGYRHLLQRKDKGVYQLHPLLREFFALKGKPRDDRQRLMAAVCQSLVAVAKTIPHTPTLEQIAQIEPNLPHLEEVVTALYSGLSDEDLLGIFTALDWFWRGQGAYTQAEPWGEQCLQVAQERWGDNHPETATSLNNLAALYSDQGRYSEAEHLYQQALEIQRRVLGKEHPDTAQTLSNLALGYKDQGRYDKAEPLLQQSLKIFEQYLGVEHPSTTFSMGNLASLSRAQGRYADATYLYEKVLEIQRRVLGTEHPHAAQSIHNLASLYHDQGLYDKAELLYQQALGIRCRLLGEEHPDTAQTLNSLAELYRNQGRYDEAAPLLQKSLEIQRHQLGDDHPITAISIGNLANIYKAQEFYEQAELLYIEVLKIHRKALGDEHPYVSIGLNNLAGLYCDQGRYDKAEPIYQQALEIQHCVLGKEHPDVAHTLNNLAALYWHQERYIEAQPLYQQALEIRRRVLGDDHPDTATSLNNLAELYRVQGRAGGAESLLAQALAICEQVLGPQHPLTVTVQNNLERLRRQSS